MNNTTEELASVEYFPNYFCQLIDLPESGIECSTEFPQVCVGCATVGKYLIGETLHDYSSAGHITSVLLWIATLLTGILGLLTNSLIIIVIRHMHSNRPFDFLLMILACFDMACCVSATLLNTMAVFIYGNWVHNGVGAMSLYLLAMTLFLFTRTGSTFMTMLITIERFLVIAFPFNFQTWFTERKTKLFAFFVLLTSLLLNTPRFLSYKVEYNNYYHHSNLTSLQDFEYIVRCTSLHSLFYEKLHDLHSQVDFWLPLPILLVLNLLSYSHMLKMQKRKKKLKRAQRKEVEALKLFLPVVIVLFVTNIVPIATFSAIFFAKTWYRELSTGTALAGAINSAVNFHIYYHQRSSFKMEAKAVFSEWFGCGFVTSGQQLVDNNKEDSS